MRTYDLLIVFIYCFFYSESIKFILLIIVVLFILAAFSMNILIGSSYSLFFQLFFLRFLKDRFLYFAVFFGQCRMKDDSAVVLEGTIYQRDVLVLMGV